MQDIETVELEALLDYMYAGEVEVKHSNLSSLIRAAECLHIKGLAVPDEDPRQSDKPAKNAPHNPSSKNKTDYRSPDVNKRNNSNTYKNSTDSNKRTFTESSCNNQSSVFDSGKKNYNEKISRISNNNNCSSTKRRKFEHDSVYSDDGNITSLPLHPTYTDNDIDESSECVTIQSDTIGNDTVIGEEAENLTTNSNKSSSNIPSANISPVSNRNKRDRSRMNEQEVLPTQMIKVEMEEASEVQIEKTEEPDYDDGDAAETSEVSLTQYIVIFNYFHW